jgi:aerobic-type carbon monoxide dehydrogenase small subunit (CoxS/CutS family)/CO/xanthine dehydrogenase FAD-binding subunit
MLTRGIRSYHRPGRLDEAVGLARQGATPLAGGTRLLAAPSEVSNILDLSALGLDQMVAEDGDLIVGAMVTLQDVIDSPAAAAATAGLLPEACAAHSASRMIRGMATLGGESIRGAHDSEVAAALLALNAVYVVAHPDGTIESPALRFIRRPTEDLAGGGILKAILIPGVPHGTALERVAVVPSAPSLVSVAVSLTFSGGKCGRARVALTGLAGPPARVLEGEARLEGTAGHAAAVAACVEQIQARLVFRDDAHAPAAYRQKVAAVLAERGLRRALERAHGRAAPPSPRARPVRANRAPMAPLPYFTSGRIDVTFNGVLRAATVEARTTLLDLLRREGFRGAKHGCETGECGACTVLLDGRPVASCLTLAVRAHARSIQTVEGLGTPDALHPIQQAFVEAGAIQCGYCTPAMELCAKALLDALPDPTEAEVRDALAGCLCRCTGYVKPVEAVLRASRQRGR